MTVIHWLNSVSGSFTNASDRSGGVVPGASDDAILDAARVRLYTFTVSRAWGCRAWSECMFWARTPSAPMKTRVGGGC